MHTLKKIGSSGQVSIGKRYAGRQVSIDQIEQGVWVIKLGEFIPDNERWLITSEVNRNVDEAIEWASKNPPTETNLKTLSKLLE